MVNIVPLLFYFLFTSTILSPLYSNTAIWLFVFIPLFDLNFIKSLRYINKKTFQVLCVFFLLFIMSFDYLLLLKLICIVIVVSYLIYTYENKQFYLYFFVSTNIVIGLIQYVLFTFFDIKFLDPAVIGKFLYGDFAMTTGNTFAPGFLLDLRISGLNREPGFFSSLIISALVIIFFDNIDRGKKILYYLLFFLGLIITFSKVTLVFLIVLPIIYISRRILDAFGTVFIGLISVFIISLLVNYFYYKTNIQLHPTLVYEGGSIYHRTIGYYVISDLSFDDLLFGAARDIESLADKLPYIKNSEWWGYDRLLFDNSGLSFVIINFGLLSFILMLFLLKRLNIKGSMLFIFIILTISVNPLTTTSFVMLSYFILFYGRDLNEKCS